MQGMTSSKATTSSKVGNPAPMAATKVSKDDSGLHDLKDLATSVKARRTRRRTTQIEAQQSLLTSSAALDAVVLPDPKKSVAVTLPTIAPIEKIAANADSGLSTKAVASSVAATAANVTSAVEPAAESASGSKKGLIAVVGIVAVAAIAFVVLNKDKSSDVTAKGSAGSATTNAVVSADDPSESGNTIATNTAGTVTPEATAIPATETTENGTGAGTENGTGTENGARIENGGGDGDGTQVVPEAKAVVVDPSDNKRKTLTPEEKAAADEKKAERLAAKALAKAERAAKAEKETTPKVEKGGKKETSGKSDSLDDVLSSVTGGLDSPKATKETSTPTKKTLGRGDVKKAMRKVSGAAKACYKQEEFSGMVSVKYSVIPSGNLTNIVATGAHKSSKTGKCVVRAVKKAKFPPFSGSPMSFSFPFMLSP